MDQPIQSLRNLRNDPRKNGYRTAQQEKREDEDQRQSNNVRGVDEPHFCRSAGAQAHAAQREHCQYEEEKTEHLSPEKRVAVPRLIAEVIDDQQARQDQRENEQQPATPSVYVDVHVKTPDRHINHIVNPCCGVDQYGQFRRAHEKAYTGQKGQDKAQKGVVDAYDQESDGKTRTDKDQQLGQPGRDHV